MLGMYESDSEMSKGRRKVGEGMVVGAQGDFNERGRVGNRDGLVESAILAE